MSNGAIMPRASGIVNIVLGIAILIIAIYGMINVGIPIWHNISILPVLPALIQLVTGLMAYNRSNYMNTMVTLGIINIILYPVTLIFAAFVFVNLTLGVYFRHDNTILVAMTFMFVYSLFANTAFNVLMIVGTRIITRAQRRQGHG